MAIYRIEMMTTDNYHRYMCGSYDYYVENIDIEANSAQEAIEIAKTQNPEMVINKNWVKSLEELATIKAERETARKVAAEKKAAKKARKAAREAAKAAEKGMTIEEYNEYKKQMTNARRYEREADTFEKDIEILRREIAWRRKKAKEIREKFGE